MIGEGLEDTVCLPRVAVMVDNLMHKVRLHGLSIIPMLLGFGCNVPGAMDTRILETRKKLYCSNPDRNYRSLHGLLLRLIEGAIIQ